LHPISTKTWDDLKLSKQFVNALNEGGLTHPTLIQEKSIPLILGGQKVVGIAQTGTGKTAAYLLPVLYKFKFSQGTAPRGLILAPTKELVIQIANHARMLAKYTDLRVVELYGGVGPKQQLDILKAGSDLIIATPGRFLEIYQKSAIETKLIKTLVIDEADRMLDMNFVPQIRKIFEVLPPKRQDLLFSATYSERVERLAKEFIDFPVKVEVTPQASVTNQVKQTAYKTANFKTKLNLLQHLLVGEDFNRVMIFSRTRQTVINLAKFLSRMEIGALREMHSNKGQNARINALKDFKEGEVRLLISTDVSARGIDINKVSHVINFDVPVLYEDYVHRIGRTGRAFNTGVAITFVTPSDEYHIAKIEELIKEKIKVQSMPEGVSIEETPYEESQKIKREIDRQKMREDPSYRGAFHERKKK
jgi:ATP-dependent RNA helicase RhlE